MASSIKGSPFCYEYMSVLFFSNFPEGQQIPWVLPPGHVPVSNFGPQAAFPMPPLGPPPSYPGSNFHHSPVDSHHQTPPVQTPQGMVILPDMQVGAIMGVVYRYTVFV